MRGRVAWREESGDLDDAEEGIGVENEGDGELIGSEFREIIRCIWLTRLRML